MVVPKGVFHTGPITLKSNVCLHLEEGAVLQGDLMMRPDEKQHTGDAVLESLHQSEPKTIAIADESIKQ